MNKGPLFLKDNYYHIFYRTSTPLSNYKLHEITGQARTSTRNEQWSRIWESSAAKSIEHVFPQSKGASERIEPGKDGVFVHRLGNLILLPPGLNSQLQDSEPTQKAESYRKTGLLCATEVAITIVQTGWAKKQIEERENKLIEWIKETWA